MLKPIIDLSKYNTVKDFKAVKDNVSGIILRIGYRGYSSGKILMDSKFMSYYSQCMSLDIPLGVYFVTQAVSVDESKEEADFIYKNVNIDTLELGAWLDSEYSTHPSHKGRGDLLSREKRTECHNAFFDYFNSKNIICGLYAGDYWLNDNLVYNDLHSYYFWIPRYGINNGTVSKSPAHDCHLHQYTSVGKIDGISGFVDLNLSIRDLAKDDFILPDLNDYGLKLIEALEINGYDSSFEYRKKIAEKLGMLDYKGSADQNMEIIAKLR